MASDALIWMTPPPGPTAVLKCCGQPEQVDEPVEDMRLDLRHGRARRPQHPLRTEPGRDQLGEDRRPRRVGREVREPARRLPVRDARQDDLVEVAQQRGERLGLLGRRVGQPPRISPGFTVEHDRQLAAHAPCSPRPTPRPRGRGGGTRRASCGSGQSLVGNLVTALGARRRRSWGSSAAGEARAARDAGVRPGRDVAGQAQRRGRRSRRSLPCRAGGASRRCRRRARPPRLRPSRRRRRARPSVRRP